MSKKQKKLLIRILISLILFVFLIIYSNLFKNGALYHYITLSLSLAGYIIIGWDVLWKAAKNLIKGGLLDENFLMAVATIGAFILGEYSEGVAVMLFYQIGEWFQSYAVSKSRKSIASLMDIRPDYANIEQDGKLIKVDPEEVRQGDNIIVKPGERIPLDGVVISGNSSLDTSALTGESVPRDVFTGDEVISGCINQSGILKIKTTKSFGESTVTKILDLVENSSEKKAKTENFITRFAKYYTPVVVILAVVIAFIVPLLTKQQFSDWIYRALTFLVISCPCALVISIPLSFFGGIGGASKIGVLIKGSNYLEALAKTETVVFDKTGTLTKGSFEVTSIFPAGNINKNKLVETAAYAESYSNHPIAVSIKSAYGKPIDNSRISDIKESAGFGIEAIVDGSVVLAGNSKLMEKESIEYQKCETPGTAVYISVDGTYAGYILIEDEIKPDSKKAIDALESVGVKQTIMLTGDSDKIGQSVAKKLGIQKAYTQLLPDEKVKKIEQLMQQNRENTPLAFVGDGINDAPVLARADIGIAMGGLGSDAAIEAADVVLMTDEPLKIASAIKIARKTIRIAYENIIFALSVKAVILLLGALGFASMWAAVFADVGVAVIAILNAIRALKVKNPDK